MGKEKMNRVAFLDSIQCAKHIAVDGNKCIKSSVDFPVDHPEDVLFKLNGLVLNFLSAL
mgnify:CR=1 FL=1